MDPDRADAPSDPESILEAFEREHWDSLILPALREAASEGETETADVWLRSSSRSDAALSLSEAASALETPLYEIFDAWRENSWDYISENSEALTRSALEDILRRQARSALEQARASAESLGEDPDALEEALLERLLDRAREDSEEIPFDIEWRLRGSISAKASLDFHLPRESLFGPGSSLLGEPLAPRLLSESSEWPTLLCWARIPAHAFANACRERALQEIERRRSDGSAPPSAEESLERWLLENRLEDPWLPDPASWPEPFRSKALLWPQPDPDEPAFALEDLLEALERSSYDTVTFEIDASLSAETLEEHSLLLDWADGSPILGEKALSRTLLLEPGEGVLADGEPLRSLRPLPLPADAFSLSDSAPDGPELSVPMGPERQAARLARQALSSLRRACSPERSLPGPALADSIAQAREWALRARALDPRSGPFLLESLLALPESEALLAARASLEAALPPLPADEPFEPPQFGPLGAWRSGWLRGACLAQARGARLLRSAIALGDASSARALLERGADARSCGPDGSPSAHLIPTAAALLGPRAFKPFPLEAVSLPWPDGALLLPDASGASLLSKLRDPQAAAALCRLGADPRDAWGGFSEAQRALLEAAYLEAAPAASSAKSARRGL